MGKKHFTLFLYLAFFALILFLIPACKKTAAEENAAYYRTETENPGALHILNVTPKGKTSSPHESETIVIIFDRPMVPLEALPKRKDSSILTLEPNFPGKFRWMGTKILSFTPEKRFPFATEIRVKVPSGTKSLDGCSLKKDFTWSFQTIRPLLLKHFPRNKQKWIKLDPQILLIFNQAIIKEKVKDFLSFTGVSKTNKEISIDFIIKSLSAKQLKEKGIKASAEKICILKPSKSLQPDFTYFIELREGLPAKEGPLGMEKSYLFKFETFKEFKFDSLEAVENHNPRDPLHFRFSNPVVYKSFVNKIRFKPQVAIPDYYLNWNRGNSNIYLSLPMQPETAYTLWIDPDLEDEFGNKLGTEVKLNFSTAPYSPSATMTTGQGILEAYGDLSYPFYVLNVQKVLFQSRVVGKEEIIPLLTTKKIFWSDEKFDRKAFFHSEKVLNISPPKNKRKIYPLDLKKLIPEKFGLIFLQLDTYLQDRWSRYPKAFLQVTELGISAKFSPENNLVWVTELKTGLPVPDAKVEIRDDFNKIHWQGKTNAKGKVQTPGWKRLEITGKNKWSKPRQWIFVTRGKDLAFTSSEWGTGTYPYRFGIQYDWNPQPKKIQGYIFTERGIYRAGEIVHVKGIIRNREKGEWRLPSGSEVDCEILDPFRKQIFKDKIKLDSYGSFSFDIPTEEEASLGHYHIKAKIPPEMKGEKDTTLSTSFRIEAFRPAEFEVHLKTYKENFIFNDDYQAEVRANYLFGGAMAAQNASWHLRLNPAYFSPPGHKGYIFGNQIDRWEWDEREKSRLLSSGEKPLNSEGKLLIKSKLLPEKEKDSVFSTLEATVQGPSRRSITNRIQTLVHRGEFYIGLKSATTFLKRGTDLQINVLTVNPEGKVLPEKDVLVKLIKREWHSVRRAGYGGRFQWRSEKKDTEIAVKSVQTKNEPAVISFLPEKSGFYILRAEGKDSRKNFITTTTYLYVTGRDYVPWERRDDDTVELVTDSKNYRPGDTAQILVKSPYKKAKALVTVEREFILDSRVVDIQGNSDQINIPILPDYIPNVFVSVLLVQGRTSPRVADRNEDIGKPSFKIGYVNLGVNPSEKRLNIDIQKDKKDYKPGENVTLHIKVKDSVGKGTESCVSVAVVDLGVLNLIGYKTPDPFSLFYSQKHLSVQTSETRLHIIGQREYGEKGEDVGGGAGERALFAMAPELAEVELRGDFKSTAYWNPSVLTDNQGSASISFTLPDNLTTFRIMAVAQTLKSEFGRQETTFRVSKPLLLQSALPRFARLGDKFRGGVVVHNFSSQKKEIVLSCKAKGILLHEERNTRQFSLDTGKSKEVLFSFEVDKPGKAILAFRAKMGEESDGLEVSLPLYMPRPTETVALFEHTTESTEQKIHIPENSYLPESKIEIQASSSALSGLKGCVDYLTEYPYLCLEQRLSSVLPYIVAYDVILDFELSKFGQKEMKKYVRRIIQEIYKYQKGNGGFGLWPESSYDSPFISCYAVFALVKARKAGYEVNGRNLELATRYLKNLVRGKLGKKNYPYSSRVWKTIQAFALYDLALLDKQEPAYIENLYQERGNLSLYGQTLLLKSLGKSRDYSEVQNTLLQELMNKIKITPTQAHFEDDEGRSGGWIYSSNTRTTALILQSLIEIGSDHTLLPAIVRWLIERRKAGRWSSTQENFYVFYALNDFYKTYEKSIPDFEAEIRLAKTQLLAEIFKDQRDRVAQIGISLEPFGPGETIPLKIKMKGEGTLYYGVRMTYAPKEKLEPRDEGFAIIKEIQNLDGKPITSVKAGSLIVVSLKIVVPRESLFVVVDDPLPAGFEAINPVFLTESREEQRKLQETKGRRQYRWWGGFYHIEMHDDRVLLFADHLMPGIHTHKYLVRALTYGTFQNPGTRAEEMYSPEVFGRCAEQIVKIEK